MDEDPNQTAAAQPLRAAKASSSALYMTPSPSELSMFGEADVDDELELEEDAARAERLHERPYAVDRNGHASGHRNGRVVRFVSDAGAVAKAERQKLMRELLDALYLGTSNFLLAYNTRAGIGVLLRIFRLLLKRNIRGVFDLKQLLDEKHLSFRVDAVSFGLFLGWSTGGYRGLRALLPFLIKKYLASAAKNKHALSDDLQQHQRRIEQLSALTSGAIAGTALMFVDAKKRRSFALYALTRALQCAYNTAKRNDYWHFWGSDWKYGDTLLFAMSSAQVMYAYVMRPSTLPPEYFRFIQNTGPVERETLTLVQQSNRGLPIDQKLLWSLIKRKSINATAIEKLPQNIGDIVPCRLVHCNAESCTVGWALCFRRAFGKTFPLYLSLFIVPSVVIHFKKFLTNPVRTLSRAVLGATRSNTFLASFVTAYLALICAHRRVTSVDHRIVYYLAGLGASTTILLEPKSRRSGKELSARRHASFVDILTTLISLSLFLLMLELALYVLPRAIDSLYMILRDRKIFSGVRNGEVVLFSASMAVMMYCYEHEKESVSPFLYSIMKRFLSTAADKKKAYLAMLRQKKEAREQQERAVLQQM